LVLYSSGCSKYDQEEMVTKVCGINAETTQRSKKLQLERRNREIVLFLSNDSEFPTTVFTT